MSECPKGNSDCQTTPVPSSGTGVVFDKTALKTERIVFMIEIYEVELLPFHK